MNKLSINTIVECGNKLLELVPEEKRDTVKAVVVITVSGITIGTAFFKAGSEFLDKANAFSHEGLPAYEKAFVNIISTLKKEEHTLEAHDYNEEVIPDDDIAA